MAVFELVLSLLLGGVGLALLAPRLGLPWPALLALAGAALAFVPGAPEVALNPGLALALFVAPVLLDAAYDASPRDLRDNWAPVGGLVLGAVGVTTVAVAAVTRWLEPSLPWAATVTLGAIVAPPDAAAATAVLRQVRLPHRLVVILEGESLLNDASALLVYRVAVGAAVGGVTVWTMPLLALAALGGVALGVVLAKGVLVVLARVEDTAPSVVLQFLSTFGVWLLAEALDLSAVLTMVAYAVTLARTAPERMGARRRLNSYAVWDVAVFVLNVLAFILVGLQLRGILARLDGQAGRYALVAAAVLAVAVLVRVVWVMGYYAVAQWKDRRFGKGNAPRPLSPRSAQGGIVISWCGMRGIVTLAAALALPGGFPGRDLIVFASFCVVLGTLVVQGLTLRPYCPIWCCRGTRAWRRRWSWPGPRPRRPRSTPSARRWTRAGTGKPGTCWSGRTGHGCRPAHGPAGGPPTPPAWVRCVAGRWGPSAPASRRCAGRNASAMTPSTASRRSWTGPRPRWTGRVAEGVHPILLLLGCIQRLGEAEPQTSTNVDRCHSRSGGASRCARGRERSGHCSASCRFRPPYPSGAAANGCAGREVRPSCGYQYYSCRRGES